MISRLAKRALYYHGTSSRNLRRILKEGLIPRGTKKMYNEEPKFQVSQKTFGGVYFSRNPEIALEYAGNATEEGASLLLVVATLESRSPTVTLDEDALTRFLGSIDLFDRYDLERFFPELNTRRKSKTELFKITDNVFHTIRTMDWKPVAMRYLNLLHKSYPSVATSRNATKLLPAIEGMLQATAIHLLEIWIKAHEFNFPKIQKTFPRFKRSLEHILSLIPQATEGGSGHGSQNIRIQRPIAYRGNNRILSVLEIEFDYIEYRNREQRLTMIKIWYGKFPDSRLTRQITDYFSSPFYSIRSRSGQLIETNLQDQF